MKPDLSNVKLIEVRESAWVPPETQESRQFRHMEERLNEVIATFSGEGISNERIFHALADAMMRALPGNPFRKSSDITVIEHDWSMLTAHLQRVDYLRRQYYRALLSAGYVDTASRDQ
jgi:hypothetical protein